MDTLLILHEHVLQVAKTVTLFFARQQTEMWILG